MRQVIWNDCVSELQVPVLILVTCNVTCSPISRHVGPGTFSGTHHSSYVNKIVKQTYASHKMLHMIVVSVLLQ